MPPAASAARTVIYGISASHLAIGFAVLMLALFLPALISPKKFKQAMDKFLSLSDETLRIVGIMEMFMAFFFINTRWTISLTSNRSWIAALGYLLAFEGLLWIWTPGSLKRLYAKWNKGEISYWIMTVVGLAFAVGFGYLGLKVY